MDPIFEMMEVYIDFSHWCTYFCMSAQNPYVNKNYGKTGNFCFLLHDFFVSEYFFTVSMYFFHSEKKKTERPSPILKVHIVKQNLHILWTANPLHRIYVQK